MGGLLRIGLARRGCPGDQLRSRDLDKLVHSLSALYIQVNVALNAYKEFCIQQHPRIETQQQQLPMAPVLRSARHTGSSPLGNKDITRDQLHKSQGVVATCSDSHGGNAGAIGAISQQLSQLLQQQGKLSHQPSAGQKQVPSPAVMSQQGSQQPGLSAEHILSVLGSAAQLQSLPSELCQALADAIVHLIPQMLPVQLAEALEAFSTIPSSLQHVRHALPQALTSYLRHNQNQFDAAGTIAVAEALVKCKQPSSFTLLCMLAMDHIKDMTGQQLVQLLTAFAHAQHHNEAVMGAASKLVIDLLAHQGYGLQPSPSCPAGTATAAQVQQGAADSQQQLQLTQIKGLTADQLVQVLGVCASLRHHDAQLLEAAATAVVRSVKHLQLQQVVQVVVTCAELNHYSMSLFEEACRLAQQAVVEQQHVSTGSPSSKHSSHFQDKQQEALHGRISSIHSSLTGLAWSCALMNHLDIPFWQQLAAYSSSMDVQQLQEDELLRWFQVQSCLTDAAITNPELRSLSLSNHLLLAAQGAWLQRLQGQSLTSFHKDVHEALKQAGAKCRLNVALDGPLVVNLALQNRPFRHRVAVQLETPDMFAANAPHTALGPTAARWRALQARGWQVVSLRYSDWSRLKTAEEKILYMYNIKEAVAGRAPGLAPDVVQAGAIADLSRQGGQQALGKKLWKLLMD